MLFFRQYFLSLIFTLVSCYMVFGQTSTLKTVFREHWNNPILVNQKAITNIDSQVGFVTATINNISTGVNMNGENLQLTSSFQNTNTQIASINISFSREIKNLSFPYSIVTQGASIFDLTSAPLGIKTKREGENFYVIAQPLNNLALQVNISVNNSNAFSGQLNELILEIPYFEMEVDGNTFNYNTSSPSWSISSDEIQYGSPTNISLSTFINDRDTGQLMWRVNASEKFSVSNISYFDTIPLNNGINILGSIDFNGSINGPPIETISIFSQDDLSTTKTQTIIINMKGAHALGNVWQDLLMWFKADEGLELNSSQEVIKWKDYSGNQRDITSIEGQRPKMKNRKSTHALNFSPVVTFSNNQHLSELSDLPNIDAKNFPDLQIFAVFKQSEDAEGALWGISDNIGNDRVFYQNGLLGGGSTTNIRVPNIRKNVPVLLSITYKRGGSSTIKMNGRITNEFTSNLLTTNVNRLQVGNSGNSTKSFNGDIAELIFYGRALAEDETKKIESALALKYGLTLPYKYVAPNGHLIWEEDVQYSNNIVGVYNDLSQGLLKIQSKSTEGILEIVSEKILNSPSFLLVGSDNEELSLTKKVGNDNISRLKRIWKSNLKGITSHKISIKFSLSKEVEFNVKGINRWKLLIGKNADFSDAKVYPFDPISTAQDNSLIVFKGVKINDNDFFTLATQVNVISGTAFFDRGVRPVGIGREMALVINDFEYGTVLTDKNGKFEFNIPFFQENDVFAVFSKDDALYGLTISILDSQKSYTSFDFYRRNILLRKDDYIPLKNVDFEILTKHETIKKNIKIDPITKSLTTLENQSLYLSEKLIYQPSADLVVGGDIVINGIFEADQGKIGENYYLAGSWILASTARFNPGNSKVIMNGNNQSLMGSSTFYDFEKKSLKTNSLFFEENKVQVFSNDFVLTGVDENNLLSIRTVNNGGVLKYGSSAFIQPLRIPSMNTSEERAFLDVRDNTNLGDFVIAPTASVNSGNTQEWFKPVVFFTNATSNLVENTIIHKVSVELSSSSSSETVIPFKIGLTSTAGKLDFVFPSRTLIFPPTPNNSNNINDRKRNIEISILQDNLYELDESILIKLIETGLINANINKSLDEHRITILNDDPPPSVKLKIENTILEEKNKLTNTPSDTKIKVFTNVVAETDITVSLSFDGKAILGRDYNISSEFLVINAGEKEKFITISAVDDDLYEIPESFEIEIESVQFGSEHGLQKVFGTIISDDKEPSVQLKVDTNTSKEGGHVIQVFLSSDKISEADILADLVTLGDAVKEKDYIISAEQFVIPAGVNKSNVLIMNIIDDAEIEFNEYITINIEKLQNAIVTQEQQLTIQIKDNDPDLSKIRISASPKIILGDGISTSEILLRLYDSDNKSISISGGVVNISTDNGVISPTRDLNNGYYSATLTSSQILNDTSIEAQISATLNSSRSSQTANVIFQPSNDSDGDGLLDYCECPDFNSCPDTDNDAVPNYLDTDSDNDGITDNDECALSSTNCNMCLDADQDDIPDYLESNVHDFDQDGKPNYLDFDSDNDGKKDSEECDELGDCPDNDNDNIPDWDDPDDNPSDPQGGDSDRDGVADKIECFNGYPCIDADQDGIPNYFKNDADIKDCVNGVCPDCDDDGIINIFDNDDDDNGIIDTKEQTLIDINVDYDKDGIFPLCDSDDDGDGILDIIECPNSNNCPDSDNDGRYDFVDDDSDDDGIGDKRECKNVYSCEDTDLDGIPDYLDTDSDNDGVNDKRECTSSTDGYCPDNDGDGIPNHLDVDANNNGIHDGLETTLDCDSDGLESFRDSFELCPQLIPTSGFFSPNGDGINDFWYIENLEKLGSNTVKIFNRLGKLVFQINDYDNHNPQKRFGINSISGLSLSNKEILSGTYFFQIETNDLDPIQGYLHILTK